MEGSDCQTVGIEKTDPKKDMSVHPSFAALPLLDRVPFDQHVRALTETQRTFVTFLDAWFQAPRQDLMVVSGSPGTGKTFTVMKTLQHVKVPLLKMAPTGKVAYHIGGATIHSALHLPWQPSSFLHELQTTLEQLDPEDDGYPAQCLALSQPLQEHLAWDDAYQPQVIVLDEVGMVPFWLVYQVIHYFFARYPAAPQLFILIGDRYQLKPVKCPYNIFNCPSFFPGHTLNLTDNKRFTRAYQDVIQELKACMDRDNPDQFFHQVQQTFPILETFYEPLLRECQRVLVYTNHSVEKYNAFYLKQLPGPNLVFPAVVDQRVNMDQCLTLKPQCDVVVTRNCSVPNGMLLRFLRYQDEGDKLLCQSLETGQEVRVARIQGQFPVRVGFATTIHKFQGETIDDPLILIQLDECKDLHLVYTALSRVRSHKQIAGIILS